MGEMKKIDPCCLCCKFLWNLVFTCLLLLQLLMIPLIMSVLYVWAQLNRDMIVSFWFGTRFKVQNMPFHLSAEIPLLLEMYFLTRPEEVTAEQCPNDSPLTLLVPCVSLAYLETFAGCP